MISQCSCRSDLWQVVSGVYWDKILFKKEEEEGEEEGEEEKEEEEEEADWSTVLFGTHSVHKYFFSPSMWQLRLQWVENCKLYVYMIIIIAFSVFVVVVHIKYKYW